MLISKSVLTETRGHHAIRKLTCARCRGYGGGGGGGGAEEKIYTQTLEWNSKAHLGFLEADSRVPACLSFVVAFPLTDRFHLRNLPSRSLWSGAVTFKNKRQFQRQRQRQTTRTGASHVSGIHADRHGYNCWKRTLFGETNVESMP